MPDLMEKAIASLNEISGDRRDEVAWAVMQLLEAPSTFELSDEDKTAIDEAEVEIERDGLATQSEVRAVWAKHGL